MVKKQSNIYIPKWLHEQLKSFFQENREALEKNGINSVNGLATKLIETGLEALSGWLDAVREYAIDILSSDDS